MRDTTAARKYAEALFLEAQAHNQLLACQQGLEEISRIAKLKNSLIRVLAHPFIPLSEKRTMIHAALGEYATPLLERFLNLLVEKRRFNLIFVIAEAFQEFVDRAQNVQSLRVKVAFPLSEPQRKKLQEKLEAWLHSKVRMDLQIDPQLIGGVMVQTRDQECDLSLRAQLKKMYSKILAAS